MESSRYPQRQLKTRPNMPAPLQQATMSALQNMELGIQAQHTSDRIMNKVRREPTNQECVSELAD